MWRCVNGEWFLMFLRHYINCQTFENEGAPFLHNTRNHLCTDSVTSHDLNPQQHCSENLRLHKHIFPSRGFSCFQFSLSLLFLTSCSVFQSSPTRMFYLIILYAVLFSCHLSFVFYPVSLTQFLPYICIVPLPHELCCFLL